MFDSAGVEILEPDECMKLLGKEQIGRLVFTDRALPAVQPVNFILDDGFLVIRTRPGSKLAVAAEGTVMALAIDHLDLEHRFGWSVTAVGYTEEVTDSVELQRLRTLPLHPWAPGRRDHMIRLRIEHLTGRRTGRL